MDQLARAWDARIESLLVRLPGRVAGWVAWLREPSRHVVRAAAGSLLVLGGVFSILPVLGLWMLPLGLALLAEDIPGLKPRLERAARWAERLLPTSWRRRAERRAPAEARLSPPGRRD